MAHQSARSIYRNFKKGSEFDWDPCCLSSSHPQASVRKVTLHGCSFVEMHRKSGGQKPEAGCETMVAVQSRGMKPLLHGCSFVEMHRKSGGQKPEAGCETMVVVQCRGVKPLLHGCSFVEMHRKSGGQKPEAGCEAMVGPTKSRHEASPTWMFNCGNASKFG
jgi:hypothetical protein